MPVAPDRAVPVQAGTQPPGLSAQSLKLWLAAAYYRRCADELAVRDSRVSL